MVQQLVEPIDQQIRIKIFEGGAKMDELESKGFICTAICITSCGAGCLACIADGIVVILDAMTGGGAMNLGMSIQYQA